MADTFDTRASVDDILGKVAHEQAGLRMGHLDPHDFQDEDGTRYSTDAEKALQTFVEAIAEVIELRTHSCQWSDQDICQICDADGRA